MSDDSDEGDQPGETSPPTKRAKKNDSDAGKEAQLASITKNDGRPHSVEPGVHFFKKTKKWVAAVTDVLEKDRKGKPKLVSAGHFLHEADAIAARRALAEQIDTKFWTTVQGWARADPLTKDLPLAPLDPADGEPGTVYWRPNHLDGHRPFRVVRRADGKEGAKWFRACNVCAKGRDNTVRTVHFCCTHMPEEHRTSYRQDKRDVTKNPNAGNLVIICSRCCNIQLDAKRWETKGGNGLCAGCEATLKEEAADAGAAAPPKSQSWEDHVLDKLIPLVGEPYEMRDDHKAMLGVLRQRGRITRHRKARADEPDCDTNHRRRPDLLYVLRHPETGRIIACVSVEIDEHSHADRTTECELAKVDETREALQAWGQREGFTDDRAGHGRPDIAAPFYYVFKLNPNACDCTPTVRLDARIALLAARVKAVFALDRDELLDRALESESRAPIVECLFHHSARAAHHLAAFAAEGASTNWDWRGNTTVA